MTLQIRLMLGLLGLGVAFSFMGYSEFQQADSVKPKPDVVPCAVFEARGPLDNNHIRLTSFNVTEDFYFAYEEQEYGSGYSEVLIPVFPLNRNSDPKNEELSVILRFPNVTGDQHLVELIDQDSVTGIAAAMGSSLDHEYRGLLQEGYPGIQLDKCYVVNVDQRLPTRSRGLGMMAFGGVALLAFAGIIAWNHTSNNAGIHVDTSSPNYMSQRIPTELDPDKFGSEAAAQEEATPFQASAVDDEVQSYQREFEERYGIRPAEDEQPTGSY